MTEMTTRSQLEAELVAVTSNYSWTWDRHTQDLISLFPGATSHLHPLQRVRAFTDADYDGYLADRAFIAASQEAAGRIPAQQRVPNAEIAYFSPEFGVSEKLPQYSGGLGVLAGDHLKAASDLDLPLVAVGLFYRDGFFHQAIRDGRQREMFERSDPRSLGFEQMPVIVDITMDDRIVKARVWRADIGRTRLFLLDTDLELNDERGRKVSDRLYSGDKEHRIRQELLMGVGGVRALRQLGFDPKVFHLNEGHAGFLALELIGEEVSRGLTLDRALDVVRDKIVFTTHTPVPAGIDRFPHELMERYLGVWSDRYGVSISDLLDLAHMPGEAETFNMAAFALRVARKTNGVSKLHGETSRAMFSGVPGGSQISSVTNGVHARTWVSSGLQELFEESIGDDWVSTSADSWVGVEKIKDDDIRRVRRANRERLIDLITKRIGQRHSLDPDILTIGFARRFATYKRADLLLSDMERLEALLTDNERPVQFVFAGKSHPADGPGKEILHRVASFAASEVSLGRFVFVPDYQMQVARRMTAGCDVWLNNPVRPQEASGTSGEKAALNGCLNVSILDGWWDECFDGENGWKIESSRSTDRSQRDRDEAGSLYSVLSDEVVPMFYEDGSAMSDAWLERMRHNWKTLGPFVTAARMVRDYDQQVYRPLDRP
ncbi:MAG: glycosyltransferase family 1 protein [Acidimicrobiia bacterium]|nr:MAG: glycosyltransferase family 1 protein [Acidimicrobiia bacterium]